MSVRCGRSGPPAGEPVRTALASVLLVLTATLLCGVSAPSLGAQAVEAPREASGADFDLSDVVGSARAAQARFERRRVARLPLSLGAPSGGCDEHVGRFCTWYSEGEWYPTPEDPETVAMRAELVSTLDSLQEAAPSSDWILGQRVWYRAEGGGWADALAVAERCGPVDPWWCPALRGFAYHGAGRYEEAEAAFDEMLSLMEPEPAERWSTPRWPVDGDVRALLAAEAAGRRDADTTSSPDAEARPHMLLDRLWTLADPLWLVSGNDRRSAHFARWTVTELRARARNPFHIPWGDDLSELTVRHGWEIGWERSAGRSSLAVDDVIGHKHPEGRDYMPPGSALREPADASAEELRPDRGRPRSLYAPAYAPVLLPMEGQIAVFPRVAGAVVVATFFLPPDTTFHADHDHPLPWMEPGDQENLDDRTGLYLLPLGDEAASSHATRPRGIARRGATAGALSLRADPGEYVLSAESWSPSRRSAGRTRLGVTVRPALEDVATLSDILVLRPAAEGLDPTTLEAALDLALPGHALGRDEPFAIGWEVSGLGFRPETLRFEVSVEPTDRGLIRRVGEFLGLADRPRPLVLSWEEPAPGEPGHDFHYLALDLPPIDAGRYRVVLVLRAAEREEVRRAVQIEIVDPR